MARSLPPLVQAFAITDRLGRATLLFIRRWQDLIDGWAWVPTQTITAVAGQTAAIATTSVYTVQTAGRYRVSWYVRKTVADGAASSVTVTIGWTSDVALTASGPALTTDTTTANQSGTLILPAAAASAITLATAYSSTTPNKMTYAIDVTVEALAA